MEITWPTGRALYPSCGSTEMTLSPTWRMAKTLTDTALAWPRYGAHVALKAQSGVAAGFLAWRAGSPTSAFLLASHWRVKLLTALQDSTWAGQQEQVALARQYGVMIRVYQVNQPAWTMKPDFSDFPKVLKCFLYSFHLKSAHAPPALSLT